MKNYQKIFAIVIAGLVAGSVQAGDIKAQVNAPASAPAATAAAKQAQVMMARQSAPQQFVDADLVPTARKMVNGAIGATDLPIERLTGSIDKAPAQSFAGSSVTAAHAGPSKVGLNDTQTVANRIAEPASELLLLVALSALAIAIRRQSPT